MTRFDFAGKVVLVTGSSRGIGAATIHAFAEAGATCAVHYFPDAAGEGQADAEKLLAAFPQPGRAYAADVSKEEPMRNLFAQIQADLGGLDVLVNNAGILKDRTLKKMSPDEWHAVIDTNLTGVFHGCKFGAEILRDGGRIVNVASVAGLVGFPGQANYAAAKAGVIGLTRSIAKELSRRNITVNAVAPGVVETPMLGGIKPEVTAEYIKQIPMSRLGRPADIAHAILFLASAESSYITGQVLPVTGGWV
jgi:3-oxoacyl-[acyl-carrier protein] reductase